MCGKSAKKKILTVNIENRNVFDKKTRVLMKNMCYLSALVPKSKYTKKLKIKYKNNVEDKL